MSNLTAKTILVYAPTFPPAFKAGGPAKTLEALISDTPEDFIPLILAPVRDLGSKDRLKGIDKGWNPNKYGPGFVNYQSGIGLFLNSIRKPKKPNFAIYLNSFFNPKFALFPMFLFWLNRWPNNKLVVAPRGEFHPSALKQRPTLKKIIIRSIQATGLQTQIIWHASNEIEAEHIRYCWGNKAQVIVREDETGLPEHAQIPQESDDPIAKVVFLSRIVGNKGLHKILLALKEVPTPIKFDIYGPFENSTYVEECKKLALGSVHNISFGGPIPPEKIRSIFSRYDLFAFPTQFESFGHVIPEALSVACPVAVPSTTPWTETIRNGGGFVLEAPVEYSLTKVLQKLAGQTPSQRMKHRLSAKHAYDTWASAPKDKHIFELVNEFEGSK